jgi:hypothetical protein
MQARNQLKPLQTFFRVPSRKQVTLLEQTTPILESFMKTKHIHDHPPLVILTDLAIAIQEY